MNQRLETRVPAYLAVFVRERAAELDLAIAAYLELIISVEYDRYNKTIEQERKLP